MPDNKVVTRFAPSPTGHFHVGGIRSALFNFLFARQNNGTYILRSEDTDKERSKKEYEDEFLELFDWLGLKHDMFFRQSDRLKLYKKYIQKMMDDGFAYLSKETPIEEGQRDEVIRFKNPNKKVTFGDLVLGDITVDTTDLGDFIIARDMNEPLYHLTAVIDDFEMRITHVIRGQEHAPNTPRQILLQEAIGAPRPTYAHLPLILNKEKAKLSKRDVSVPPAIEYKKMGYLPEALLNFVALIGWNPGNDKEIFTLDELLKEFSLERIQKSGGVFNIEKLNWINKEHMKLLDDEEFYKKVDLYLGPNFKEEIKSLKNLNEEGYKSFVLSFRGKIVKFGDLKNLMQYSQIYPTNETIITLKPAEFAGPTTPTTGYKESEKSVGYTGYIGPSDYLLSSRNPIIRDDKLILKNSPKDIVVEHLKKVQKLIEENNWETIIEKNDESKLWTYAGEEGRGRVLWPLRVALSWEEKSPDPFEIMKAIGKDSSLKRIKNALDVLNGKNLFTETTKTMID